MSLNYKNKAIVLSVLAPKVLEETNGQASLLPSCKSWQDSVTSLGKYFVLWYNKKLKNGYTTSCKKILQSEVVEIVRKNKNFYKSYINQLK